MAEMLNETCAQAPRAAPVERAWSREKPNLYPLNKAVVSRAQELGG